MYGRSSHCHCHEINRERVEIKKENHCSTAIMIKAILVFNNQGKVRLLKFFTHYVRSVCVCQYMFIVVEYCVE